MRIDWPPLGEVCVLATVDLLAGCVQDPPRGAELVEALAGRLAGLAIGDVEVERVTVVGDLELAVTSLRRSEQGGTHSVAGVRLALREQRRPQGSAGVVAGARRALVLDEVVEGAAFAVDEDQPELRPGDRDGRGRAGAGLAAGKAGRDERGGNRQHE